MNVLTVEKQIAAIAALTEGVSIRATERLTGIHRDSIMRLGVRVGQGCAVLHDMMMRDLQVARIEMDEAWSYVAMKQRKATLRDDANIGDQYIFLAMDAAGKAILSYRIGKRDSANTHAFVHDLRARVINNPEISTDAFIMYPNAIEAAFGADCDWGVIEKRFKMEPIREAARRYSPG
jgi:IS1 family transposase